LGQVFASASIRPLGTTSGYQTASETRSPEAVDTPAGASFRLCSLRLRRSISSSAPGGAGTPPGGGTGGDASHARHGNGGPPTGLPDPDSLGYHAQKVVLAELVIDPPDEGSSLDYLRDRLPLPPDAIEPALGALQIVGLAARRGDLARASAPARYFEYLWPMLL
jgi:hypothetical protein